MAKTIATIKAAIEKANFCISKDHRLKSAIINDKVKILFTIFIRIHLSLFDLRFIIFISICLASTKRETSAKVTINLFSNITADNSVKFSTV